MDGGRLTSDGVVLVLAQIERRLGLAERLALCIEDPRAPERVWHSLAEMIRFRALMIAAGYADANECDALREDPAFKMAVGRLPETDTALCLQPTMSRLENLLTAIACNRMMDVMVGLFCESFEHVPRRVLLVTNLKGAPRWLYEDLYRGRGQAENLIKAHKLHLASDRTSCTNATANQFRLLIHTAAYWLLHTLRGLAHSTSLWRDAQFDTLRLAFVKIAARATEKVTRIKVSPTWRHVPSRCCPDNAG